MGNAIGPQTEAAEIVDAMKYRERGEDFREAINRVAFGLRDSDSHYKELREILLHMRFIPAGRVKNAIGATRETTPYNCYVSGTIEDSYVEKNGSIMDRAKEAAATMRMGGGIGYDFSTLRPRGAEIHRLGSHSSGPISFMQIFNAVCLATSSSGHRRGAQMGVLRVDHPDVEEFVRAKQNTDQLTGFNISLAVTDEFMNAVSDGKEFKLRFAGKTVRTIDAAALWEKIMRSTWDWAEPGILFIDRINEYNNLWYCETIAATNPCFSGDTKVWTAYGPKRFDELKGTTPVLTQLPDGSLVYRNMTNPRITGKGKKLITVIVRGSGRKAGSITKVRCTPNHRFWLSNGSFKKAKHLKPGDSISSVYRGAANQKGYVALRNGHEIVMEHHVAAEYRHGRRPNYPKEHAHHIHGKSNEPENIEIVDAHIHNSEHMKGDLNPIRRFPEKNIFARKRFTGTANGMYGKKHSPETLAKIGLKTKERFQDPAFREKHRTAMLNNHTVVGIEDNGDVEDVYCGTVKETGKFFVSLGDGWSEGVLVSNCGEQPLPPFGACLLGSFNLTKYLVSNLIDQLRFGDVVTLGPWRFDEDQLRDDIPHVVRAMDNVVDRARYPLAEQRAEALSKRRMGLGVMGLANAGEALGFPYGSKEFIDFQARVFRIIRDESYRASAMLAKEKGAFTLFDAPRYLKGKFIQTLPEDIKDLIEKNGIRNSHLTSVAPTGTISLTADNVSSGIEPVFSYEIKRPINTPDGPEIFTIEDYGAKFLDVKGKLTRDVTAQEHIAVLITAQQYVDSSVSKTINMTDKMPWEDFKNLYEMAWRGGAKGCTTFNSDGKRMALLSESSEEAVACKIDVQTGQRDCS